MPLYPKPASGSIRQSWQSFSLKRDRLLVVPGVMLMSVLLTSLNTIYASLVLGLALVAIYYVTWRLTSARHFSIYQRLTLMLVSPFVYVGLAIMAPIKTGVQFKLSSRI